jgi:predicted TIM-barrel fold metal-dependent hydrolase
MKAGRFVVDTHVHAQRFAAGKALAESEPKVTREWSQLGQVMSGLEPYPNTGRLEYDMDCYGVDMCVLLPAFGMTDELNVEIVRGAPDKYVAVCRGTEYQQRVLEGEEEWSIEGVCAELDRLLGTGDFVGIGEQLPYMPQPPDPRRPVSRETAVTNMLAIMEVAQGHSVPVRYHTGAPMGYTAPYSSGVLGPANFNPLWAHDLAAAFPDVPLIFEHGGIQAWWWERFYEECLHVVAAHDNVYVETGLWWRELYDSPLADPNIGPEKLLWGTDWGASMQIYSQPGRFPPSYPVQLRKEGIVHHQVDYWGWSLREVTSLRVSQDDLNLVLGGNASRLFGLEPPHRRMFREVDGAPARVPVPGG